MSSIYGDEFEVIFELIEDYRENGVKILGMEWQPDMPVVIELKTGLNFISNLLEVETKYLPKTDTYGLDYNGIVYFETRENYEQEKAMVV